MSAGAGEVVAGIVSAATEPKSGILSLECRAVASQSHIASQVVSIERPRSVKSDREVLVQP